MLDIGWSEMAFIAVIALLVIGPKDLPKAMRTVSHWVRRARSLAQEFQSGLDEIAREAELDEVKRQVTAAADFDLDGEVAKTIDPTGSMREATDITKDLESLDAPDEPVPADMIPPEAADEEAETEAATAETPATTAAAEETEEEAASADKQQANA